MKIVSFCIPVYKNAHAAFEIVKGLLRSEDQRFEVIVRDDVSNDGVRELLSEIHDERFRFYVNEKNLGAHKNWLKTLEDGEGKYLYFVIGRDKLHGENISKLIELLLSAGENNAVCMRDKIGRRKIRYYHGIMSMIRFIELSHPTGFILNREKFLTVSERGKYFDIADTYPENYLMRDVLLTEKRVRGAVISSGVWKGEMINSPFKLNSTVEYGLKNIYDSYFAPKRRTLQFFEQIDMIDDLPPEKFTRIERDIFFQNKFSSFINTVSKGWKSSCEDPRNLSHYGQEYRFVSAQEMINNMLTARKNVIKHLREKGNYNFLRDLFMIMTLTRKIIRVCIKNFRDFKPPK